MKQYENYKDSKVEWLGDVPSHWDCVSFKTYFRSNMGEVILKSDLDDNGTIPVYSATQEDKFFGYVKSSNLLLNKGDIVIPARGNIGFIKLVNEKATTTQTTIYSKKIKTINNLYVFYYLTGLRTNIFYFVQTAIPQITVQEINEKKILVPPIKEQEKIATYLDSKIGVIDNLISKKKQQVQLFKENRQAIINDVVLNGLNPNVKLKDTNIEYIGKIPIHWEVTKLKYIGNLKNGINIGREAFGKGFPFVSYKDVYDNRVLKQNYSGLIESTHQDRILYSIQANDLLFTRTSETVKELGMVALCSENIENAVFAGFLIRLRLSTKKLNSKYLLYFFNANFNRNFYLQNFNIVTRASLSQDLLTRFPILIPPLAEQQEIVKYLERKTSIIDQLIEKVNKSIELLEEYKISLISHIVTGKMKIS